jgi:hypothetical protein
VSRLVAIVLFAALVCVLVPAGCAGCRVIVPPVPQPAVDAGAGGSPGVGGNVVVDAAPPVDECVPEGSDDCGRAGETLCRLQCRDRAGAPRWRTPAGRPFAEVCRAARDDGRDWRPDCLARITDCSQVEAAYRTSGGAACPR